MRVTLETKAATKKAILHAAQRLFAEKGFEATTTRDIAQAAGIASGTLFNYFPTKEAVVACLANEASTQAIAEADSRSSAIETLEEDLFALIAAGLRKLKPMRKYLPALLETSLNPIAVTAQDDSASLRIGHLEAVTALAAKHCQRPLSPTALQLYWTLYSGVLIFWAGDNSPRQEDTLALIDDSLNMYVGWLKEQSRSNAKRS